MADRVRLLNSSPENAVQEKPTSPAPEKTVPPSPEQTYIIQIPRDQVIRVPPPENSLRIEQYTRRKNRRSRRRLFCLFSLILAVAVAGGVIYLLHHLKSPLYTIDRISIHGLNLTSTESQSISPEFDVAVRAKNLNDIFGIYYYQKASSVKVCYREVTLANGVLPTFYQPSSNVTVLHTALKGYGVEIASVEAKALVDGKSKRRVPLTLKIKAPVKLKVGSIQTWQITVKVNCRLTVDRLTARARVVSQNCNNGVNLLWG